MPTNQFTTKKNEKENNINTNKNLGAFKKSSKNLNVYKIFFYIMLSFMSYFMLLFVLYSIYGFNFYLNDIFLNANNFKIIIIKK